jgi:hypothetical protein
MKTRTPKRGERKRSTKDMASPKAADPRGGIIAVLIGLQQAPGAQRLATPQLSPQRPN